MGLTVCAGSAGVVLLNVCVGSQLGLAGMRIAIAAPWQLRSSKLGLAAVLVYSCLSWRVCASFDCTQLLGSEVETALLLTPFLQSVHV